MIRQVVTIDGASFDVGVTRIRRKARIQDGQNAGDAKRGDWIRDVYGTFYDYILTFDTSPGSPLWPEHAFFYRRHHRRRG